MSKYSGIFDKSTDNFTDKSTNVPGDLIINDITPNNKIFKEHPLNKNQTFFKQSTVITKDECSNFIVQKAKHIIIVPSESRTTSDYVNLFEYTELTGIRAAQIEKFNNPFVDITGLRDPIAIAKREFNERKCPLLIRRFINTKTTDGVDWDYYEDWDPNVMIHPNQARTSE